MLQAGTVTLFPQVNTIGDEGVTVNRLVHVYTPLEGDVEVEPQVLVAVVPQLPTVYVQVTSTYPPHAAGATDGALFVNVPVLHPPPLTVVEAKNVAHAASTCACVLQDCTVTLFPQLSVTAGAACTVNRLVQDTELVLVLLPQPDCCPQALTV
mgnify:CR=1 FL=1